MAGATYKTFKRIRSGGMADVFLGISRSESGFRKPCAIKKILPEFADNPVYIDVLRREVRIGQSLNHGNVVQVIAFDRVEGADAIIMEYVEGVDLSRLLARCVETSMPMSVPMSLLILGEASRGLAYVHTRVDHSTGRRMQIIHADVAPSNILLSYEGEIKVADFGIACALINGEVNDWKGAAGKQSYMAPEQFKGEALRPSADVFGLGCIFFELLTGKQLLDATKPPDQRFQALFSDAILARVRLVLPEADTKIEEILMQCLAFDPRERYGEVREMERDVLEILQERYGSYTRQRLGTFIKMMFTKEHAELSELLHASMNESDQNGGVITPVPDAVPFEPFAPIAVPDGAPLKTHKGKEVVYDGGPSEISPSRPSLPSAVLAGAASQNFARADGSRSGTQGGRSMNQNPAQAQVQSHSQLQPSAPGLGQKHSQAPTNLTFDERFGEGHDAGRRRIWPFAVVLGLAVVAYLALQFMQPEQTAAARVPPTKGAPAPKAKAKNAAPWPGKPTQPKGSKP